MTPRVSPRPIPRVGGYALTKPSPTKIRCKAYTAPPLRGGELITTIAPGTSLGPIEAEEQSEMFVTIQVRGYWINIWRAHWNSPDQKGGTNYATLVTQPEIDDWEQHGWRHLPASEVPASPPSVAKPEPESEPNPSACG